MTPDDPQFVEALLEYHLGLADSAGRAAVAGRLQASAQARRQQAALQRALQPLDAYHVEPPAELSETILTHVHAKTATLKFPGRRAAHAAATVADDARAATGHTLTWRELLSLAAAIAVFVGIFIPGLNAARMAAQRNLCLSHMRVLGNAIGDYAAANAGVLPLAADASHIDWTAGPRTRLPRVGSQTEVLLTGRYVQSRKYFQCPGQPNAAPAAGGGYSWPLFVRPQRVERLPSAAPGVSDANPLVHDGVFQPTDAPRNSDAHGPNAGQFLQRIDGSAGWQTTPRVGIGGDDIFRVRDLPDYVERQPLSSISDAFLVP